MLTPSGAVAEKRGEQPRNVEEDEAVEEVAVATVAASMAVGDKRQSKGRRERKNN